MEGSDLKVEMVTSFENCDTMIVGKIMKFWYSSYTWFWPFCTGKGDIEIELMLLNQDLNKVWHKKYSAHSRNFTFGGAYGYDGMIKKAMNEILNQIQYDLGSTHFKALL
jgi:hypothetical protein